MQPGESEDFRILVLGRNKERRAEEIKSRIANAAMEIGSEENLSGAFDWINIGDILDYSELPQEKLRQIADILRPRGLIEASFAGKYARLALSHIQDAVKIANRNARNEEEKIANAKTILQSLSGNNFFHRLENKLPHDPEDYSAEEFKDLFISPPENSFSVMDIYSLATAAGLDLEFMGEGYDPARYIDMKKFSVDFSSFDKQKLQAIAEIISCRFFNHEVRMRKA